MIKISFNFANNQEKQKRELQKFSEAITKQANRAYQKTFGTSLKLRDWQESSRFSTSSRLASRKVTSLSELKTSRKLRLQRLYSAAFRNKYNEIRKEYKIQDQKYREKDYYRWKKSAKGKKTARWSGKKIQFVSEGLASGFLRDSIFSGLRRGGNAYVDMANLMVQGSYEINWDAYNRRTDGKVYYLAFIDYLVSLGVLEDREDFLDFRQSDWDTIAKFMLEIIREDFVPDFIEAIESVEQEI